MTTTKTLLGLVAAALVAASDDRGRHGNCRRRPDDHGRHRLRSAVHHQGARHRHRHLGQGRAADDGARAPERLRHQADRSTRPRAGAHDLADEEGLDLRLLAQPHRVVLRARARHDLHDPRQGDGSEEPGRNAEGHVQDAADQDHGPRRAGHDRLRASAARLQCITKAQISQKAPAASIASVDIATATEARIQLVVSRDKPVQTASGLAQYDVVSNQLSPGFDEVVQDPGRRTRLRHDVLRRRPGQGRHRAG